ncbi:MAG: hypothetical protein AB8G22_10635 [Saprospiraceae bacterium]
MNNKSYKKNNAMRSLKTWFLSILGLGVFTIASAHVNPHAATKPAEGDRSTNAVQYRNDCDQAVAKYDMAINNVRARLLTGGDVWWDPGASDGRYVVPKVPAGQPEVSAIFAGAVWLGGVDPAGNLKIAAQQYGSASGNADFWPGPLDPMEGTTEQQTCSDWDRFFVVTGEEIDEHLRNYQKAIDGNLPYNEGDIPRNIRGWPARGNQFFFDIHRFELPNTSQGLGAFFDQDKDGFYEPDEGDYPVIEIRGCIGNPQYPDEMVFWIYNDNGNIHSESNADPIQMEVQVQGFAYATNDEINDMTFQRYKLINRAIESIDSTFFAMWVDADLGCFTDDFVGCDTARSLAYIYNADAVDGDNGSACSGGVNTYGDEVPIIGVDYFRGPLDEFGNELGMSSFTYFNNGGQGGPPGGTTDPGSAQEYYNLLSGSWKTGEPFEFGGDGYQEGTFPIEYAFPNAPDDGAGWSMCTFPNNPNYDRRTVQASGPFRLDPGAVNELIVGVVFVADQDYPCPSVRALQGADDIAQSLFDACFEITDGPDAPDVDIVELDQELVLVLTNDESSNNFEESYAQVGLNVPSGQSDSLYTFEGYRIFQMSGPDVTIADLGDPNKARLVISVDVKNNREKLYNWIPIDSPTEETYYQPVLQNEGVTNDGVRHTFNIINDQFTGTRLINHRKYYYTALAYAQNNFEDFDPENPSIGQRQPYLEGRKNIGDGNNPFYTAIPRPIVDRVVNSDYGDGAVVTRLDGIGVGGNFLDISNETRQAIIDGSFDGTITYNAGGGPVNISVYNPLEVVDGEFLLTFIDENLDNDELDDNVRWTLTDLGSDNKTITSASTIDKLNEQLLPEYGFALTIGQTDDAGDGADATNGVVGYIEQYEEGGNPWLTGIADGQPLGVIFPPPFDQGLNFIATAGGQEDEVLDPTQAFSAVGPGTWVPYTLANWRNNAATYLTPSWTTGTNSSIVRNNNELEDLNNVDIVFTSDKELWSRCIIVETYNDAMGGFAPIEPPLSIGDANSMDVRAEPSVTKFDNDGDGRPDVDPDEEREGFGWFPGYAIDVETGERLNIFFGENSLFRQELADALPGEFNEAPTGADMMFNPESQMLINAGGTQSLLNFYAGGNHFIYVTRQPYDGCESTYERLGPSPSPLRKVRALQSVTWTSMAMLESTADMLSYADGLIPTDVTVKLRVDNPYQVSEGTAEYNGYPTYRFTLDGVAPAEQSTEDVESALDMIKVVPNPYYAYSAYEVSQFTNTVKITNLPAKATITIYSLDGRFIRRYNRDETPAAPEGSSRGIRSKQIIPDVEWDLRNTKGIPVASGVYLIHVDAGALGERVIKWFGAQREFDPAGL